MTQQSRFRIKITLVGLIALATLIFVAWAMSVPIETESKHMNDPAQVSELAQSLHLPNPNKPAQQSDLNIKEKLRFENARYPA